MTCLAATLHDPDGRLLPALDRQADHLVGYEAVAVAATPQTDPRLLARLRQLGVLVVPGEARVGVSRRTALRAARGAAGGDVLACDFDRWLHWSGRFPEELAGVPGRLRRRRPAPWYACLGRTARAFASHPPVQRVAERATNRVLSLLAGRRLDAVAGACWLSAEGAELILQRSVEPTNATDLEWPALVLRVDSRRLAALACEGLEFETAGFHGDEVAAAGGEAAWIRERYERPEVWRDRLRLAADSAAAACRVLGDGADLHPSASGQGQPRPRSSALDPSGPPREVGERGEPPGGGDVTVRWEFGFGRSSPLADGSTGTGPPHDAAPAEAAGRSATATESSTGSG